MPRYIPMPAYPDRMPIDISFAFGDKKPAGKHGFCKAVGDDLRFEDGTLAKFWGVNFNGGANFPEHDYARKVARRLAMAGVNIVRFHQLDAEWNTPNLFSFCKGPRLTTTPDGSLPEGYDEVMLSTDAVPTQIPNMIVFDNILLSAIGRARNTDMMFDGEKMLDIGRAPIMAEVIEADVCLNTVHGDKMKVWGINAESFYAGKLPTTYEDGVLRFRIGDAQNPACYYLIVKE